MHPKLMQAEFEHVHVPLNQKQPGMGSKNDGQRCKMSMVIAALEVHRKDSAVETGTFVGKRLLWEVEWESDRTEDDRLDYQPFSEIEAFRRFLVLSWRHNDGRFFSQSSSETQKSKAAEKVQ